MSASRVSLRELIAFTVVAIAALSAGSEATGAISGAATPPPGLSDQPCPDGSEGRSEPMQALARALVADGPIDPAVLKAYSDGALERAKADEARTKDDWADLCLYRGANDALAAKGGARVVFLGDSITELWQAADPELFTDGTVDRGISGQTSGQALLRFFPDVVALHPKVVHLLIGTNDIAGNNGPSRPEDLQNNIRAMIEIAKANHIRVILASITPAASFPWRPDIHPTDQILAMNHWLYDLARREGLIYIDYYAVLAAPNGAMRDGFSRDGVHPLVNGYALMKPLALDAIRRSLRQAP